MSSLPHIPSRRDAYLSTGITDDGLQGRVQYAIGTLELLFSTPRPKQLRCHPLPIPMDCKNGQGLKITTYSLVPRLKINGYFSLTPSPSELGASQPE